MFRVFLSMLLLLYDLLLFMRKYTEGFFAFEYPCCVFRSDDREFLAYINLEVIELAFEKESHLSNPVVCIDVGIYRVGLDELHGYEGHSIILRGQDLVSTFFALQQLSFHH